MPHLIKKLKQRIIILDSCKEIGDAELRIFRCQKETEEYVVRPPELIISGGVVELEIDLSDDKYIAMGGLYKWHLMNTNNELIEKGWLKVQ